ncbi:hypothetical protein CEXT_173021 [Caerostris extrusa]|uniref:Uncharacterized protein n=1 Tax=Caerostris extrusa TaxID=172846 RepID=A0AAV4P6C9_CAEEX|nr:hypothetical protein CEXT_173021 [Caerostris extrusa]
MPFNSLLIPIDITRTKKGENEWRFISLGDDSPRVEIHQERFLKRTTSSIKHNKGVFDNKQEQIVGSGKMCMVILVTPIIRLFQNRPRHRESASDNPRGPEELWAVNRPLN